MAEKIRSALVAADAAAELRGKYEEIYRSSDTWLYQKSHGVHTAVLTLISPHLPGRRFLDVGCGAGRLALMCARFAAEVEGVDFSGRAIEIARLNAACTGARNATFRVGDADGLVSARPFDVVTMIGVLEHVPDPVATLLRIGGLLPSGGRLVVSCPGFLNFRGFVYLPLLTLLGLPMSLADLRQVYPWDVEAWAAETGFVVEGRAGALYRYAWDEPGARDMILRVPLAARDKGLAPQALDCERFGRWMLDQMQGTRAYLDALVARRVLKRLTRQVVLPMSRTADVPEALWERLRRYINEDLDADPYWCDEEPFCQYGGETIHVLRKA